MLPVETTKNSWWQRGGWNSLSVVRTNPRSKKYERKYDRQKEWISLKKKIAKNIVQNLTQIIKDKGGFQRK